MDDREGGERGISVLIARHDDNDDDDITVQKVIWILLSNNCKLFYPYEFLRFDVYYFACDFSDCCPHLYLGVSRISWQE